MPGMFDEFIDKSRIMPLPKTEETEGLMSLRPEDKAHVDNLNQVDQSVPKHGGLFDEFLQEPSKPGPVENTHLFDEFQQNASFKPTGMFNDLVKKDLAYHRYA